jgi:hypothetical protein
MRHTLFHNITITQEELAPLFDKRVSTKAPFSYQSNLKRRLLLKEESQEAPKY